MVSRPPPTPSPASLTKPATRQTNRNKTFVQMVFMFLSKIINMVPKWSPAPLPIPG